MAVFFLAVLPAFLIGWYVLFRFVLGHEFAAKAPENFWGLATWHLLGVALPEEVFFRGWLQERLSGLLPKRWTLFGAEFGPGLFIASALFALGHLISRSNPIHLLVFFPGLLFGLFRERSGSILVPALAHGGGNFFFLILQSWATR